MKRIFINISLSLILVFICGSCRKLKTPEAVAERESWIAGFKDSVEFYEKRMTEIEIHLNQVNDQINSMLEEFEYVNNPKEVSGYYILKGWKNKLPLTKTGIYARINENEKLEMIATLAGSTFNRISVGEENNKFLSEVVPNDQAFNYRHKGYNTVYFSGGKADTIAQYIAAHRNDKVDLNFIEGSKTTRFLIPTDEKEMIAKTSDFFDVKSQAAQLQKELWINSRKVATFKRMMDENSEIKEN